MLSIFAVHEKGYRSTILGLMKTKMNEKFYKLVMAS